MPNEKRLSGHGVSWCATCDGFFFRGQDIVVVGGGDTAMEEATFLTRFAASVTIVHRRDELRASKIMQDRAFANEKIRFVWDSEVVDILGEAKISGVRLRNLKTGEESELAASGLFVAIGHDPRTELVKGQVDLDDEGYIKVASPTTRTNLDGVFAAGDVVDHTYRQAITAAGTGSAARARLRALAVRPRQLIRTASPHNRGRAGTLGAIEHVTDASFDADVLKNDKIVIVDFWAEWCGPCRQVAPILEEIANEQAEKLTVVKLNVDENPATAGKYGVLQIPTLNVYKNGEVVKQIIGAKPKAMLLRELEGII